MRSPSSTKSVVRNGKKPREKNGVKKWRKKNPGGKKRACLPRISRGHFFPRRLFTVTQDGQKRDYS